MFTPAMTATRTSSPPVMRAKASSTAVRGPPFLYLLPLAEAMTTGFTVLGATTVGPWAKPGRAPAATIPAAVPALTNSRRLILCVIGRSYVPLWQLPAEISARPPFNRACRFPAHGLPVVSCVAALRRLRVLDGPAQTVQPEGVEEIAGPLLYFTRVQIAALALRHEAAEPPARVGVDLDEFLGRVPGAEVVAPAAEHGVEIGDDDSHVLHPGPVPAGQLLHALSDPLHAAMGRPALEEVDTLACLLPDRTAHPLPQVTAEEVETLFTPREIDLPRLVRVQLQTEPVQDLPDPGLGLLARLRRAAQHDKVVRIAHQSAQVSTPFHPHGVEDMQVDVRQKWRDHAALRCPREQRYLAPVFHHPRTQPLPQQLQHTTIRDAPRHEHHQLLVVDASEIVPDVGVEYVIRTRDPKLPDRLQSTQSPTPRPEAV